MVRYGNSILLFSILILCFVYSYRWQHMEVYESFVVVIICASESRVDQIKILFTANVVYTAQGLWSL